MTEERAAQGAWRTVALDKDAWNQGLKRWEEQDPEWASYQQLAIEGWLGSNWLAQMKRLS